MYKPQHGDVDIGLAALCKHAQYSQTLTQQEIADVCGCSRQYIFLLEKRAMNKLKKKAHRKTISDYQYHQPSSLIHALMQFENSYAD